MSRTQNRNPSLDIVRIIAFCTVVGVHFFLNTDFYNTPIEKPIHFIMVIVRTFMLVCVPLFIILTGYLMNKKTMSKKYYMGILKTLSIYVIASIPCYFHRQYFIGEKANIKDLVLSILDFTAAEYSWYIEMYIGLFLLIPFINLIYNNLISKKQKQVLLLTLIVLTMLPTILNTYNFNDINWWLKPALTTAYDKIFPAYWNNFYPITYYFIGAYLNEFRPKIKPIKNLIFYIATGIIFGLYCIYRSYNHIFISAAYQSWNGFPVMIMSILLFVLIVNIKTEKFSSTTKLLLAKLSDLSLGAYLISSLVDDLVYNFIEKIITNDLEEQFRYYPVCIFVIIVLSFLLSYLINNIYDILNSIFSKMIIAIKRKHSIVS